MERNVIASLSQVSCDAVVTDFVFKMSKSATAEITARVKFGFNTFHDRTGFVIRDLVHAAEKETNTCAIEIISVRKGMTMWDMEKHLSLNDEEIMKCNPGLTVPLEDDRKVVVYRQLRD